MKKSRRALPQKFAIRSEKIDLVHAHQVPSGAIAHEAARSMRVPFHFTVHGTYCDASFLSLLKSNATINCVSPAVWRMLQSEGIHAFLVPNGVDPLEYHPIDNSYRSYLRRKLGLPQQAQVVMYASRLSWEKAPFIHIVGEVLNMSAYYAVSDCVIGTGRISLHELPAVRTGMEQLVRRS